MDVKEFYKCYFNTPAFQTPDSLSLMKNTYVRSVMEKEKFIYKYIAFDDNIKLNKNKLKTFLEDKIWCSPYYIFYQNDPREFEILYDANVVHSNVGFTTEWVNRFVENVKLSTCLTSFAIKTSEDMWNQYTNLGRGFCIKYSVSDTNCFFPILYDNKDSYSFTQDIIATLDILKKNPSLITLNNVHFRRFAELPYLLKNNGDNYQKDYRYENEIRLLIETPSEFSPVNDPEVSYLKNHNFPGFNLPVQSAGISPVEIILDINKCDYREELLHGAKEKMCSVTFK